jgi:hypothetical protein
MTTSIHASEATTVLAPSATLAGATTLAIGGLNVADTINKADIVAVVRQEAEEQLLASRSELERELRGLETKASGFEVELTKMANKIVADANLQTAKDAAKALAKFTGLKYETSITLTSRDDDKQVVNATISVFRAGETSSYAKTNHDTKIDYTNEMASVVKELKVVRRDISKAQIQLVSIKKDLANLPALERKAHAELAKHTLNKTADGQKLLEQLRNIRIKAQD